MQEPATPTVDRSRSAARVARRRAHTGLGLLLVGPLLGLLLVGVLSLATINEVRVGGPQDDRVTQAHALVADTTIPSQDLTSIRGTLMLLPASIGTPDEARLRTQVDEAEVRYSEGHAYWDTHLSDPALRDTLLVEAYEPVASLFRQVHEHLWPAMDRGSQTIAAGIVHTELLPLLDRHEQAMRRVSVQAADVVTATSNRANDAITLRTRVFLAVLGAVMVLVAIAAVAALRLSRRDGPQLARAERDEARQLGSEPDAGPEAVAQAPTALDDSDDGDVDADGADAGDRPATLAEALPTFSPFDPPGIDEMPEDDRSPESAPAR